MRHPAPISILLCTLMTSFQMAQAQGPLPTARHAFTVVAHRGDHTQAPENTLLAYQHAIEAGADYVEIDLRTTRDGQLVIMHDATVDRMTDGKGPVRDYSFDSLRALKVWDKAHPQWGQQQIPTFQEVLSTCKDKIYIYLDFKNADPAQAYSLIQQMGMEHQLVVYINAPMQATRWRQVAPQMPLMNSLPESVKDTAALARYLEGHDYEILDGDFDQYTPEMVEMARAKGRMVLPDIQGADEGPAKWDRGLALKVGGLQTDHPALLIAYLKEKNIR